MKKSLPEAEFGGKMALTSPFVPGGYKNSKQSSGGQKCLCNPEKKLPFSHTNNNKNTDNHRHSLPLSMPKTDSQARGDARTNGRSRRQDQKSEQNNSCNELVKVPNIKGIIIHPGTPTTIELRSQKAQSHQLNCSTFQSFGPNALNVSDDEDADCYTPNTNTHRSSCLKPNGSHQTQPPYPVQQKCSQKNFSSPVQRQPSPSQLQQPKRITSPTRLPNQQMTSFRCQQQLNHTQQQLNHTQQQQKALFAMNNLNPSVQRQTSPSQMPHLQSRPTRGQQQVASSECHCNPPNQGQQNHSQLKNPNMANGRNQSPQTKQAESMPKQEGTLEDITCKKCVRSASQEQQNDKKCENVLPPNGSRSQQPLKAQQNNANNGSGAKKVEQKPNCGCTLEYFPCNCDQSAPQKQEPEQTNPKSENKAPPVISNSDQSSKPQQCNDTKGSGAKQKTEHQPKCKCSLEYLWKTFGIHMDSFPCICPNIKNQKESHKSEQNISSQGSGAKQKKSPHKCGCALEYLWNTYGMLLESFPCICSNMKNENKSQKKPQQTTGTQEAKAKPSKSQPNCGCTLEYLWHTYGMHMESFPCICSKIKKLMEPDKSEKCCSSQGKQTKPQPGCKCTLEYLWQTQGILMENFPCICSQSVPNSNQSQKSQQCNEGAKEKQTEQPPICGCPSENVSSNCNNSEKDKQGESLEAIFKKRYYEWNCNASEEDSCCPGSGAKKKKAPLQCDCDNTVGQLKTQLKYSECSCDESVKTKTLEKNNGSEAVKDSCSSKMESAQKQDISSQKQPLTKEDQSKNTDCCTQSDQQKSQMQETFSSIFKKRYFEWNCDSSDQSKNTDCCTAQSQSEKPKSDCCTPQMQETLSSVFKKRYFEWNCDSSDQSKNTDCCTAQSEKTETLLSVFKKRYFEWINTLSSDQSKNTDCCTSQSQMPETLSSVFKKRYFEWNCDSSDQSKNTDCCNPQSDCCSPQSQMPETLSSVFKKRYFEWNCDSSDQSKGTDCCTSESEKPKSDCCTPQPQMPETLSSVFKKRYFEWNCDSSDQSKNTDCCTQSEKPKSDCCIPQSQMPETLSSVFKKRYYEWKCDSSDQSKNTDCCTSQSEKAKSDCCTPQSQMPETLSSIFKKRYYEWKCDSSDQSKNTDCCTSQSEKAKSDCCTPQSQMPETLSSVFKKRYYEWNCDKLDQSKNTGCCSPQSQMPETLSSIFKKRYYEWKCDSSDQSKNTDCCTSQSEKAKFDCCTPQSEMPETLSSIFKKRYYEWKCDSSDQSQNKDCCTSQSQIPVTLSSIFKKRYYEWNCDSLKSPEDSQQISSGCCEFLQEGTLSSIFKKRYYEWKCDSSKPPECSQETCPGSGAKDKEVSPKIHEEHSKCQTQEKPPVNEEQSNQQKTIVCCATKSGKLESDHTKSQREDKPPVNQDQCNLHNNTEKENLLEDCCNAQVKVNNLGCQCNQMLPEHNNNDLLTQNQEPMHQMSGCNCPQSQPITPNFQQQPPLMCSCHSSMENQFGHLSTEYYVTKISPVNDYLPPMQQQIFPGTPQPHIHAQINSYPANLNGDKTLKRIYGPAEIISQPQHQMPNYNYNQPQLQQQVYQQPSQCPVCPVSNQQGCSVCNGNSSTRSQQRILNFSIPSNSANNTNNGFRPNKDIQSNSCDINNFPLPHFCNSYCPLC